MYQDVKLPISSFDVPRQRGGTVIISDIKLVEDYVGEVGFTAEGLGSNFSSLLVSRCQDDRHTLEGELAAYLQTNSFVPTRDNRKSGMFTRYFQHQCASMS
jgi:hypothetical protein